MESAAPRPASLTARFPGLDGLRTILALLVICSHIEELKPYFPSFARLGVSSFLGSEAVQCFFVLSGFLITYLLLQERDRTGEISVRQFYWKRVLRIWPLYFTITALGFFLVPAMLNMANYQNAMQEFHPQTFALYMVILPNVALLNYPMVLGASQLWSIGIEEQFYLVWPWLARASKRLLPHVLITCIISKPILVALATSLVARLTRRGYIESEELKVYLDKALFLATLFPLECLAWGGLFGWLVHSKNEFWPRLLGHPVTQVASWAGLAVWLFAPLPALHQYKYHFISGGLVFGLAVWNIGANPRTLIGLRAPWLNKFGVLTYGLYMWHLLVIVAVFNVVNALELPAKLSPWAFQAVLYTSVIGLTVLVAQLSFKYLEMPFLSLKDRWFGQTTIAPPAAQNSLPVLGSISSVPPAKSGAFAKSERKSGNRAA